MSNLRAQDAFAWPGGLSDEHRQLLGTEEESSDHETLSDTDIMDDDDVMVRDVTVTDSDASADPR